METNIKKIGVDLDGVLAAFGYQYSQTLRELHGDHLPSVIHREQIKSWDWHKWYPLTEEQIDQGWEKAKQDPDFWLKTPLLNLAEWETFKEHFNKNHSVDVYFITTRVHTGGLSAAKQSAKWLAGHGWEHPNVVATNKKGAVCNALDIEYHVDDNAGNCLDVAENSPNTNIYVLDYPHNRGIEHKKIRRIYSLEEYVEDILKGK